MIRSAIKTFVMLPVLVLLWGVANSLGITSAVTQAAGLPDVSTWQVPGVPQIIEARNKVTNLEAKARRKARQEALKAVRAEVTRRYGPDAAALVPKDMTKRELLNFDYEALGRVAEAKGIKITPPKTPNTPKPTKQPTKAPEPTPGPGKTLYAKSLKTLNTLPVKGKAPMTGYDRDQFGTEWDDAVGNFPYSRNGCDTRNDILKRDLVNVKFDSGSDCDVASGTVPYEYYTGTKNYRFDSTDDEYATDLDIEHIVALGNVWVTGGAQWTEAKRALVANDPINLFAADPSSNRQKGDADFATWLPSNKSFRCEYASKQIAVKAKYGLWVTSAEKAAMVKVLNGCV
jgi:hypothetical protein